MSTNTPICTPLSFPVWLGILLPTGLWCLTWAIQSQIPFLYATGASIIFFPAGIRTLAVLVFSWRGALGVFIGSIITYLWFFETLYGADRPLTAAFYIALASALPAYLCMRLTLWWADIPNCLSRLTLKHITLIVVTQGLTSATALLSIYLYSGFSPAYANLPLTEVLRTWAAIATGDILGSMLLLYGVAIGAQKWVSQPHLKRLK
jgi:hypothetical protein